MYNDVFKKHITALSKLDFTCVLSTECMYRTCTMYMCSFIRAATSSRMLEYSHC